MAKRPTPLTITRGLSATIPVLADAEPAFTHDNKKLWVGWQGVNYEVGGTSSPLTTKGDIWIYGTTDTRLPVGTNGQVLKADSTQAKGLIWGTVSSTDELIKVASGDTTADYLGNKLVEGSGINITEITDGGGVKTLQIAIDWYGTGTGTGTIFPRLTDEFVKVSVNDTTIGYLGSKLVSGTGITLTEINDGGNETLQITSTASGTDELVKVASDDTAAGYLGDKLIEGSGINITEVTDGGGVKTLQIAIDWYGTGTGTGTIYPRLTDEFVKVSGNDTTIGYLLNKIVASGPITVTEINDGGNETLQIGSSASGTVTSVGLSLPAQFVVNNSPITSSGTLVVTWNNQVANTFFAGPSSGTAAIPDFRALVTADLPAGTGTVTSVGLSLPSIFAVSGSPVTTSGTLTGTLATQTANYVFAGPSSGAAAAPAFRVLTAADVPSGGGSPLTTKGDIYCFSTVNARLPAGTNSYVLVADSSQTTGLKWIAPATQSGIQSICQGRLTLESGVPISSSDQTAKGTIYFTPYMGNNIALYDGTNWILYSFSEMNYPLGASGVGAIYDIFIRYSGGAVILAANLWTDSTTRSIALALQDGIYVLSGFPDYRYVGTIRFSGTSICEDSKAKRFVWNFYHRVPRLLYVVESTTSWTYNTASYQQANASSANQVEIVVGLAGMQLDLEASHTHNGTTVAAGAYWAIGEDSTTTPAANCAPFQVWVTVISQIESGVSRLVMMPAIGYHYYAWLERGTSASTFYGYTANLRNNGLRGWIMG